MSGEDEPVTTSSQRYAPPLPRRSRFELQVESGRDAGRHVQIAPALGAVLVGTSSVCQLRLTDPEVSRRHLRLECEGPRLRVTDLDSTNGTRVDGVSIKDAWAVAGQSLLLGSTSIRVATSDDVGAEQPPQPRDHFGGFLGGCAELLRLYPLLERLAASDVSIVIEGETGTGKEVLAEALHEHSPRRNKPYVVLDCTTLPANLVEAELFGHERGAFTGSVAQRKGVFEEANGGTLFIDEIGDLDVSLQPKLLRVLERGELRRIGGSQLIRVDVRVIAATRRDLDHAVEQGSFRDDLFHRLAIGRVSLPPLRKRPGDIALLARHFWSELSPNKPLPSRLLERWEADAWPGNARELRNTIARHVATGGFEPQRTNLTTAPRTTSPELEALLHDALADLGELLWTDEPIPVARVKLLESYQKARVRRALLENAGGVDAAAKSLGIGKRYLHMLKSGPRKR
ncbi:MAG: sigma 54-interacting transcriptional regulator [Myxococcales bacterium]|nr:sigma 54-interacting transcriptional regulator [Myxococcales bacterium]